MAKENAKNGLVNGNSYSMKKSYCSSRQLTAQSVMANGVSVHGLKGESVYYAKGGQFGKRQMVICKHLRLIALAFGLLGCFFLFDSMMLAVVHHLSFRSSSGIDTTKRLQDEIRGSSAGTTGEMMYERLVDLASNALAKQNQFEQESLALWEEPFKDAAAWKPCAHKQKPMPQGHLKGSNGYILVSANGGLNQQRVAVCNAVVVSAFLNATLVVPRFLYSTVWKDSSQFGDIYREEYFLNSLKDDVRIVKELPSHLRTLDIESLGGQITDMELMKEAEPVYFIKSVLPLLKKIGVVHFLGFGNRLAFDPLPPRMQALRCKCNFHALKFVPKIQRVGSLLVQRIRKHNSRMSELDKHLLGEYMPETTTNIEKNSVGPLKYLALHMRFEMDMVAYSVCDFGGGDRERNELQAYRELHFPTLVMRMKNSSVSPTVLRKLGRCPLTPEEAALMLSALGFKHNTYIYLAGSQIYGGQARMLPFARLYPNLVTKQKLLTPSELEPFRNFSSQLAALDFIACATADVFAITDSGSQLSSLVSGYRVYHGGGRAPVLRPNKKRFANIFAMNQTIDWPEFQDRVKKMVEEGQRVRPRRKGRSIYRQPRSPGCMCKA